MAVHVDVDVDVDERRKSENEEGVALRPLTPHWGLGRDP